MREPLIFGREPSGWMLFGRPLFGGWLPMIGFVNIGCSKVGYPVPPSLAHYYRDGLIVAWLGWGIVRMWGKPRPIDGRGM